VEVSFSDGGWYADYIASFGSDVIVIDLSTCARP
jgi:hypothetical protein